LGVLRTLTPNSAAASWSMEIDAGAPLGDDFQARLASLETRRV
jgi:hypothetical protein